MLHSSDTALSVLFVAVYENWETFTLYTIRIGCGTLLSLINRVIIHVFLTTIDHIVILQTKYEHDTDKTTPIDIHMLAPVHINIYNTCLLLAAPTCNLRKRERTHTFSTSFFLLFFIIIVINYLYSSVLWHCAKRIHVDGSQPCKLKISFASPPTHTYESTALHIKWFNEMTLSSTSIHKWD